MLLTDSWHLLDDWGIPEEHAGVFVFVFLRVEEGSNVCEVVGDFAEPDLDAKITNLIDLS